MAGMDPRLAALANQALAQRNATDYRVPLPAAPMVPLAGGMDPIAEQDAALAAAQQQDLAMSGFGPAAQLGVQPGDYTADPGMSPPPPEPPPVPQVDPNAVSSGVGVPEDSLMSTPADMSYPGEQSGAGPGTQPGRYVPRPRHAGAPGEANPVPGMLKDTTGEKNEAKAGAAAHEMGRAEAQAEVEQGTQDLADTRAGTYGSVADVQDKLAGNLKPYDQQLGDLQDSHNKAVDRITNEQRERSTFMREFVPKDRRGTAQKVVGALAVAFSGLADQANLVAGLNLGLNVQTNRMDSMVSLIQRGIDRDLEQQQMMLANAKTAHAALGTELGQVNAKFGNDVDTLSIAKAMKYEQAAAEIEALKSRGLSAEQQPLADEAIGRLKMESESLLANVDRERYATLRNEEQRLKMIRAQQLRPKGPMSQKDALELEGKALDNEKKRRDLLGPDGKALSAEQLKRRSLLIGKDAPANVIARAVAGGDNAPNVFQRHTPGMLRSAGGEELDTAIDAMKDVLLRDESGASISEGDKQSKIDAWGLERGPQARKRALGMMLDELNARRESVGLPAISPVVRRGAAQ